MKVFHIIFFLLLLINVAFGQFAPFTDHGKVGLKNDKDEIIIPAQFDALGWSDGTFSLVDKVTAYQSNGLWGLINTDNHVITKAMYTSLTPGEALMLVAYKKANYSAQSSAGCILTSGKEIIPFEYDGLKISSFRIIAFKKFNNQIRYGLLDLTNRKLIPMEYKSIYSIGSLRFAVENFQNKTALYAETGKQITDFLIDSISAFKKNYAVIYQNLKQGLMDRDGQIKIEPKYREIKIQDGGSIQTHLPDEWSFLNASNQLLKQVYADSIEGLEKNIFKIRTAGYVQLVDAKFQPIVNRQFSSLGKFENNKDIFGEGKKFGAIRKNGLVVVEPIYDKIIAGPNYFLVDKKNGKDQWMLLDSAGYKQHTRLYDQIGAYTGKYFPVKNKNHWGALDLHGTEIIACVHDSLLQNVDKYVVVKFHGQYGIIDTRENWIVTPQANMIKLIAPDRYLEMGGENIFLKSFDGNVIYFTSNRLELFPGYMQEHLSTGGVWEIDLNGRILTRQMQQLASVEKIFPESEGLKAIKKDGKYGFIDSRGRLRIANRYEDVQRFNEQLAAIKIRGRWGFINHEERIIIQPVYDEVSLFQNGICIVKQNNSYGVISRDGKLTLPVRYEKIDVLANKRLLLTQEHLQGLADEKGKMLINCKYTSLQDLSNGFVIVSRDGKYSLLNLQALSVIPMIYDFMMYDHFNDRYIVLKKSDWVTIAP